MLLRAQLSQLLALLKLPPGRTTSPLPVGPSGPRLPRNSRLLTAVILLAAIALLLLPAGREAAAIVLSSWRGFDATPGETRVVERLAAQADKQGDAHQLAFLASCEPDPDLSESFATRAVKLDPSLFWIYTGRYQRPDHKVNRESLLRLQASDPGNAYVHILAAQAAVDPIAWSKFRLDGPDAAQASQIPGYPEWAADMQLAFNASRYDSYRQRFVELTHNGWRKSPEVPVSLIAYSSWFQRLPDVGLIQRYTNLLIRNAQSLEAGRPQDAERILGQIVAFGQRMYDGSETDFERLDAVEIARRGQDALQNHYARSGRQAEQQLAMAQLREFQQRKEELMRGPADSQKQSWDYFRNAAVLVHISAFSALILAVLTSASLILLEISAIPWPRFRRLRWTLCRIADIGPAAVLISAAGFLLAFRPFARTVQQYLQNPPANTAFPDFVWIYQLSFVLAYLFPLSEFVLWLCLTIALSSIAAAIVIRGIWRRLAHPHHA